MEYHPTVQTIVFVSLFLVLYLVILLKNAIRSTIDFYDLLMLSSVAIVPSVFVFFPSLAGYLAHLAGVEFPFVLLFGGLFLIVFVYLYRLVIEINHHHGRITVLIQELSLLRQQLQQVQGHRPIQKQHE